MDLQVLLEERLKWDPLRAKEYIKSFETPYAACQALLTTPIVDWTHGFNKPYFQRAEFLLHFQNVGWEVPPKLLPATIFELEVMTKRSPFYAFATFGIPFESCMKLTQLLELTISPSILAYNLVFREILEKGGISVDEVKTLLELHQVDTSKVGVISRIHPYGVHVLRRHLLQFSDPRHTIEAKLPCENWERVDKVRERTNLVNRIFLYKNKYTFESLADEFTDRVVFMIQKDLQ